MGTVPIDRQEDADLSIGPSGQQRDYLVLSQAEREAGFTRPYRCTYIHEVCGVATTMSVPIAETFARDPKFYGSTFCTRCADHFLIGEYGNFVWEDGTKVGT